MISGYDVKYADSMESANEHPFSRWEDADDYARELRHDYPDTEVLVVSVPRNGYRGI